MEATKKQSLRQTLKMSNFVLFKFDVDQVLLIYSTSTVKGHLVVGGRGQATYSKQQYDGEFVAFAGKKNIIFSQTSLSSSHKLF